MYDARTILTLLHVPRFGRRTVSQLVRWSKDHSAQTTGLADLLDVVRCELSHPVDANADTIKRAAEKADKEIDQASRLGLTIVWQGGDNYPRRLWSTPDPPAVLFVRGNPDALHSELAVAVIGTREPTEWGAKVAERFGQRFAEAGCVVVSGLALGCDTKAHEGCVAAKGRAVAVLAHGLHTVSPATNRKLADTIVDNAGCLVSEYPPGLRAMRSFFVERDRIQSGLSDGVAVVETDTKGGTMHTVAAARKQLRLLACLSHPPDHLNHPKTRGNQQLLAEGAFPLVDNGGFNRFLDELRHHAANASHEPKAPSSTELSGTLFDKVQSGRHF
jgi:DNA processing protein